MWHKITDWDAVAKNPASVGFPREDWIHGHDAEIHAEEVVHEVLKKTMIGETSKGGKAADVKEQQETNAGVEALQTRLEAVSVA
jgi:hypothetical protein